MAVNVQFSIAVHLLAGLGWRDSRAATSGELARSVNTSPSFVRRTLARLAKAGLVETSTGKTGSCRLARRPERISLLEIYRAVDAPRAIAIHDYADQKGCPVSCRIKAALEQALGQTQQALEKSLAGISLAEIIAGLKP